MLMDETNQSDGKTDFVTFEELKNDGVKCRRYLDMKGYEWVNGCNVRVRED